MKYFTERLFIFVWQMSEIFGPDAVSDVRSDLKKVVLSILQDKNSTLYRCRSDVRMLEPQ